MTYKSIELLSISLNSSAEEQLNYKRLSIKPAVLAFALAISYISLLISDKIKVKSSWINPGLGWFFFWFSINLKVISPVPQATSKTLTFSLPITLPS